MFIQLTDALRTMRQTDERGRAVPFSLEATTCDEERDTGGDNLVLTNWVLASVGRTEQPGGPGTRRVRKTQEPRPVDEYADHMRLLRNPANDQLREVHIRLITSFNGLIVLW